MELNNEKRMNNFSNRFFFISKYLLFFFFLYVMGVSCTVSYKFNGASIDYSKIKSISISDFPNMAELVYPPLSQEFSEALRDIYTHHTQLKVLQQGGDLHLEGEIVDYQLTPMSISADTYAAETKLTISIKVRYTNSKNPSDDFEKTYSAYQTFDSSKMLTDVEEELVKEIITEITENIYNDTVAKW